MESLPYIIGLFTGAALMYFCLVRGLMAENKRLWIDNDRKLRMARWLAEKCEMLASAAVCNPTYRELAKSAFLEAAEKAVVEDDWR